MGNPAIAPIALLAASALVACGRPAAPAPDVDTEAPDREAVLETVDAFFLALGEADADTMEALYADGAVVVALDLEGDAVTRRVRTPAAMMADVRADGFPVVRERYWEPVVLQRGPLAVVWAPYSIDVDGERLHCGVDVFNMSRVDAGWRIDAVAYTAEPEACEELSPPPGTAVRPDFTVLESGE